MDVARVHQEQIHVVNWLENWICEVSLNMQLITKSLQELRVTVFRSD